MITLRATPDEDQLLADLAETLGLRSKADVLRAALDYFMEHAPEVQGKKKKS